jgi:group I intron endonuclease
MVIYLVTNLVNGKKYIGMDSNNCPKYLGSGVFIKKAINKYGRENFKKEILQICETKEELLDAEKTWIDFYDAVNSKQFYNIREGGQGGDIRDYLTEEDIIKWKNNISLGKTGLRKGIPLSEKNKTGISEGLKLFYKNNLAPNTGKKHSEETKNKIRDALVGREFTEEHKRNMKKKEHFDNQTESSIKKETRDKLSKYNASLTKEEVIEIYNLSKTKQKSYSELRKIFGISISCISEIINKKTYKWVWDELENDDDQLSNIP